MTKVTTLFDFFKWANKKEVKRIVYEKQGVYSSITFISIYTSR